MGDERLENKLPYSHSAVGMLSGLLDVYAEDEGVEKSSLVFTFKGKRIFGHEHPREFNKGNYDVIDVVSAASYRCAQCICCNPNGIFKVGLYTHHS